MLGTSGVAKDQFFKNFEEYQEGIHTGCFEKVSLVACSDILCLHFLSWTIKIFTSSFIFAK